MDVQAHYPHGSSPASSQATLPQIPGGRYHIVERLSTGAIGAVYKALDTILDRPVAVKCVHLDTPFADHGPDELRERFVREARIAARLQHPNIVTIHDIVATDDRGFIIMEFIEGQSLESLLSGKNRLALPDAVRVISQLGSALDYAHARHVVHRDVKPANILVSPSLWVWVTDFGIAKSELSTNLTMAGGVLGTPDYMSPEQAKGEDVDARSDLFSLGCILFECVTGEKPFRSPSLTGVLLSIINDEPVFPLNWRSLGLPHGLKPVLHHALEKDRHRRYPTGEELVLALSQLDANAGPQPQPEPDRESGSGVATALPVEAVPTVAAPTDEVPTDAKAEAPAEVKSGPEVSSTEDAPVASPSDVRGAAEEREASTPGPSSSETAAETTPMGTEVESKSAEPPADTKWPETSAGVESSRSVSDGEAKSERPVAEVNVKESELETKSAEPPAEASAPEVKSEAPSVEPGAPEPAERDARMEAPAEAESKKPEVETKAAKPTPEARPAVPVEETKSSEACEDAESPQPPMEARVPESAAKVSDVSDVETEPRERYAESSPASPSGPPEPDASTESESEGNRGNEADGDGSSPERTVMFNTGQVERKPPAPTVAVERIQELKDESRPLRLSPNLSAELQRAEISPEEGFLLSRIDGLSRASDILSMSPMSEAETAAALLNLLDKELILFGGKTPAREPGARATAAPPAAPAKPKGIPDEATVKELDRLLALAKRQCYAELLGISADAPAASRKSAFLKIIGTYHPDKFPKASDEIREKLSRLCAEASEALDQLANPPSPRSAPPPASSTPNWSGSRPSYGSGGAPGDTGAGFDKRRYARELYDRAQRAFDIQDFWESIQLCRQAAEVDDSQAEYFHLLGRALMQNKRWRKEAADSFRRASDLDPRNLEYLGMLGAIYKAEGLQARANAILKKAQTLDPEYALPEIDGVSVEAE
jgi:serine/threonine protein kinase/tetratricopeptide (TPR) repeat protein